MADKSRIMTMFIHDSDWIPTTAQSTSVTRGTDTPSVMDNAPKQMPYLTYSYTNETFPTSFYVVVPSKACYSRRKAVFFI